MCQLIKILLAVLCLAVPAFAVDAEITFEVSDKVDSVTSVPPGWTVTMGADGSFTLHPPTAEMWVVGINGSYTTRPVLDKALYLLGTRKEIGRIPVGATCGAPVSTNLNWRLVGSGVSFCVKK